MLLQLTGVRNQGYSTRSNQGCAAWVKHTRHPTRRSCKVSTSETYNQCNLYGTSTSVYCWHCSLDDRSTV